MELIVLCLCVAAVWLASVALGLRRGEKALRAQVAQLGERLVALEVARVPLERTARGSPCGGA